MALRNVLDSDVDQITAFAIQGVNAFIALYEDERGAEATATVAAGPARHRTVTKGALSRKASGSRKRRS